MKYVHSMKFLKYSVIAYRWHHLPTMSERFRFNFPATIICFCVQVIFFTNMLQSNNDIFLQQWENIFLFKVLQQFLQQCFCQNLQQSSVWNISFYLKTSNIQVTKNTCHRIFIIKIVLHSFSPWRFLKDCVAFYSVGCKLHLINTSL